MPELPIFREIREGRTPLRKHPLLSGPLGEGLAREEYERAVAAARSHAKKLGIESGPHGPTPPELVQTLMRNVMEIKKLESGRREQLQDLAVRTVAEAHGLDVETVRGLIKKAEITDSPGFADMADKEEEELPEHLKPHLERRLTHNAFIQGYAIQHMTQALVLAKGELHAMDPKLYDRYQLFTNLAQVMQYHRPPEGHMRFMPMEIPAAGMFRLEWEGDKPKIHAQAESFPVLVQELSKGLVEINMAHGLPKEGEMSKKEAEEIIRRADKPAHEYLHFIMGPALAGRLTRALTSHKGWMDSGTGHKGRDMAYTRSLLSMVPEDKLHSNLHDVLSGGGKEKLAVENLKRHMKTVEDNYGG